MDGTHAMSLGQAVFCGLLGVLYVFAGYRMMRLTAKVKSALLFAVLGAFAASRVPNAAAVAGIVVGAGVLGYLLGDALYFVMVGLCGAIAGVVAAFVIALLMHATPGWAGGIGGAAAGAVLAILFERPVGILGTSLMGAALATMSVQGVLAAPGAVRDPQAFHDRFGPAYLALLAGLTLAGCLVQAKTAKNLPAKGAPGEGPTSPGRRVSS